MSGHTPGPWRVNGIDGALEGWKVTDTGPTQDHDGDGASEYLATVYDEGNGRLIAAAPELLEALKAVVRVADRATVEFDLARAAIAKAEGREAQS